MVDGLVELKGKTVIAWFENDKRQFSALLETLDKAVRSGREKLKAKGESEWANYMLYGDGRFQLITG